jgi:hypothetical protein
MWVGLCVLVLKGEGPQEIGRGLKPGGQGALLDGRKTSAYPQDWRYGYAGAPGFRVQLPVNIWDAHRHCPKSTAALLIVLLTNSR